MSTRTAANAESVKDSHSAPIRRLSESIAAQIAAGEVIERPASVVKELLENAVDAGATRVELWIEGAGLERIRVSDNGRGMPAAALALAFERYATSKLRDVEDLAGLDSYGFRGEALPSIAAAGEVDCLSRDRAAPSGALLRLRGGVPDPTDGPPETAAAPPGTTIEVRDLFARQLARRKFLGGERAERAAIARVCADQALACPDLALQLIMEGRRALRTGGEGQPRAVLAEIWGVTAAAAALPFAGEQAEAGLWVKGWAAPPQFHRARRAELRLFVNGRPVQSRRLSYALQEAYRELLPARRFPLVVCFLAVDPARVDCNVHPTKAQVKLADEAVAFTLIQRSLRAALLGERPLDAITVTDPADGVDPPEWMRAAPGAAAANVAGDGAQPLLLERLRPGGSITPSYGTVLPRGIDQVAGRLELSNESGGAFAGAPPLRLLGQIDAAFLVGEGPDGLYLVDQHAAHERVLYERLLRGRRVGGVLAPVQEQQALLDLAPIELNASQAYALDEFGSALAALGWEAQPFGERALRLRALPVALAWDLGSGAVKGDPSARLTAVLDALAEGVSPPSEKAGGAGDADHTEEPQRFDPAAAASACHGAVRAGDRLASEEQRALLRALESCARPHTCPHGRPTLLRLAREEILRRFLRR